MVVSAIYFASFLIRLLDGLKASQNVIRKTAEYLLDADKQNYQFSANRYIFDVVRLLFMILCSFSDNNNSHTCQYYRCNFY